MKAVLMAGGEGTRLRPMTATTPKPMLPVVNAPIMEHVLRLLRRHGITETVVTVQFLASIVRHYFGDGAEMGMSLSYATEETPLGTAGSVRNAQDALHGESFLVISGDALTDADLTGLMEFHREQGAMVTVALKRVADPLDFGIVIPDEQMRIQRFLEKPSWGQVFSDTVNTGIYVMDPAVLDLVPHDKPVDWAADVFPHLLARGEPMYGWLLDSYWEDVGTPESYLRVQADVLNRQVDVEIDGFEVSPGIWLGEGAEVHPDAVLKGPAYIGRHSQIDAGAELREFTVLGDNVVVRQGAFLHRAVLQDNCFVGPQANLRGCVLGTNTAVLRGARVEEGAIVGEGCVIEEDAYLHAGVRVYPSKTIEAGAQITDSVIWESRGSRAIFGQRGVSGLINVEITAENVVRLASAYASTLPKGSVLTTARDASRAARALKRAVISALTTGGIDVRDFEVAPMPTARFLTAHSGAAGGLMLRTTPGNQESIDITIFDGEGADISVSTQRKIERALSRQEFRRTPAAEIGELSFPTRSFETYTVALLERLDFSRVRSAGLKVVVDTAGGAAAFVLPSLLGRLGVDALTVNLGADESLATHNAAQPDRGMLRLGELVSSARAAFGVRFDHVGERMYLVDDLGDPIADERAMLLLVDLVTAEAGKGAVALPVNVTRVAEGVAAAHGVEVLWTGTATSALPDGGNHMLLLGADAAGGFIVPEVAPTIDAIAAFVRLLGLVADTRAPLSRINAAIPQAHVRRRAIPVPWAAKGTVMRAVADAAIGYPIDTTDGVRVLVDEQAWVLVLPDQDDALAHVWAEGADAATSATLLDKWSAVVEEAGR
ncbi:MAG: sugar phosphate nucleotidyltransferase [Mycobacteriales bacterium]